MIRPGTNLSVTNDSRCSCPPGRIRSSGIKHCDTEVNHLSSVLKPITNSKPADTAIVTGPSGAGKTCISKFVTERLREEVLDVETICVNYT